ncbi:glyoxalase bleomycin resistance protein dioxygenase protein [Diplodia corticola]|uniref:Glyoxalase bleomycin resistance protein dioxygenase protein n=1 Tax=Diplodia corticola TaxID=236234 RepID=A0A1J9QLE5_9PEZI|nr:glyoxalase bleomycin resistance protein dioxygenase protein [Diplodia corticola]OJD29718.1 glyoxalase bleomycin resistance protein dioxygenase protein [Diplodia corticola]
MAAPTLSNPGTVVTRPAYLAHIVLQTQPSNYQAMTSFYKTFLNATISHENDFISFLTYDSEHHRVAIIAVRTVGPKAANTSGLRHFAFTFATLEDLALAYLQRKANGIVPLWCVNHGPTTSMYYADPDGNEVETQVDNFDSADEANAYMRSDEFRTNPIGAEFDPEELVRRLKAGEDERVIKKRANVGPRNVEAIRPI